MKLPEKEKDSSTVSESTPLFVLLDAKVPNSVKLSVHLDDDYSSIKPEEEEQA